MKKKNEYGDGEEKGKKNRDYEGDYLNLERGFLR